MTEFSTLLEQGNAWLFIPSAIVLGALHGMEPGHSKTMMAAFIIAVRGTLGQAVLLGLAATVSHTAIVWLIAIGGMYFSQQWTAQTSEPYLQIASAALIMGTALWMVWRAWHQGQMAAHRHDHSHGHDHPHSHDHDHAAKKVAGLEVSAPVYQDPHERAHADDIRHRFTDRRVTTGQIVMFGLTGGLIPCPASITVLLLCLQLKKMALGAVLVMSFSVGLAATLVMAGVLAAFSVKHASQRWGGFDGWARKVPYLSGALIFLVGLYVGYHGLTAVH